MLTIESLVAAVLDTHAWVWVSAGDSRARKLENFTGAAVVSAISVWEVSMLSMKGRVELKPDEATWFLDNLESPVTLSPLTPEICITSSRLIDFHGDPADRIIVATAITLGIPLITADEKIIRWNESQQLLQVIAI